MTTKRRPKLLLPGVLLGAAAAYYLDPVSGRRRRAGLAQRMQEPPGPIRRIAGQLTRSTSKHPPGNASEPAIAGVTDVTDVTANASGSS
jgi:hypothetical protein